ncbi:unnamed protein product [Adineta steineri]|uniref:Uncharacterized protein n=1 Tax=Adineta steineri TaxID=433720 RepID=A0A815F285_9BILA|nr:unnamed protein product [Adineta steineri]CAF1323343.1 unnamed protein product [Adineta steineri]
MNSYDAYLRSKGTYHNQRNFHESNYNSKLRSLMSYSDESMDGNSFVPLDHDHDSKFPSIDSKDVDKVHKKRLRSSICSSESSSGADLIDEDSMEIPAMKSEALTIRSYNTLKPSSSTYPRKVIIKSVDIKLTSIYKPKSRPRQRRRRQRRFPRSERNNFFRENEFIPQKQSSSHFPRNRDHHSSSDQQKNEDHKLKYLYEDYSSENVHKTWKPLPLSESRKLFEYALDKYHGKFRSI